MLPVRYAPARDAAGVMCGGLFLAVRPTTGHNLRAGAPIGGRTPVSRIRAKPLAW